MSISIATMGFFNPPGGGALVGGGGAPPYRQNEEDYRLPTIIIRSVEMVNINSPVDLSDKIHIKLKDDIMEVL